MFSEGTLVVTAAKFVRVSWAGINYGIDPRFVGMRGICGQRFLFAWAGEWTPMCSCFGEVNSYCIGTYPFCTFTHFTLILMLALITLQTCRVTDPGRHVRTQVTISGMDDKV